MDEAGMALLRSIEAMIKECLEGLRREEAARGDLLGLRQKAAARQAKSRAKEYTARYGHIYERDNSKCVMCGATTSLSIDHITPRSRGGTDAPDNLRILCKRCNSQRCNRTDEEWAAVRRDISSPNGTSRDVTSPHIDEGDKGEISCSSSPEKQEQETTTPQPPVTSPDVTPIFQHWCSTWNKPKSKLTADRERKIRARLRDGYSVQRLCDAVSGSKLDPWEGRKEQCDLAQLMRPANVDKFADLWEKRQMNGNSPLWKRQGFTSPEEYAAHLETVPDG